MSTQESPSLEDFENGLPNNLPKDRLSKQKIIVRSIIGILLVVLIVLTVVNLGKNDSVTNLLGKGTVVGQVIDNKNQPIVADIVFIGLEIKGKTNNEGYFEINNIPSGEQSVAILVESGGVEYPVLIEAGKTFDIGQVKIIATPGPGD